MRRELGDRTSSEIVADLVAGVPRVKAGNTLPADLLDGDPHAAGGRCVMFLSGDDAGAQAEVARLFDAAGFWPVDLGDVRTDGHLQQAPSGSLAGHNFLKLP